MFIKYNYTLHDWTAQQIKQFIHLRTWVIAVVPFAIEKTKISFSPERKGKEDPTIA